MKNFGKEVREFLKFHGFKQWQLARQIGLDPCHFSKMLSGWFPLRPQMKARILEAMKSLAEGRKDE